jgi:sugar transferase (PEP-CTERM/EpsH1 system associated)
MKRKVIHLVYSLGYGGLEQVIVNLINNSTHYNVEHCIVTLTGEHDLYEAIVPEVAIYNLDKKPGKDISIHWKLYKLLKSLNADVIHSYNFGTIEYQFTAYIAGVKTRAHSEHGRDISDQNGANFKHNITRKFAAFILHHFVVVSPDLDYWALNKLKISKNKVQLIFNGVDTQLFHPNNKKFKKTTIISIGRLDPIKNHELLIMAYSNALLTDENLQSSQLLIIGDGNERKSLEKLIKENSLTKRCKLLGFKKNVYKYLCHSHLFILSSKYEAMPMTLLEAMSSGLPVISTNVGGVQNILTNDIGWLVPSDDVESLQGAITEAFCEDKLRTEKAHLSREAAMEYSVEEMVSKYMSLYNIIRT